MKRQANYGPQGKCISPPVLCKFYGHTAAPIHLCLVSGCLRAAEAESSSCDRLYDLQRLKYLLSGSYSRRFLTLQPEIHEPAWIALENKMLKEKDDFTKECLKYVTVHISF